jgi:hypothetical protein
LGHKNGLLDYVKNNFRNNTHRLCKRIISTEIKFSELKEGDFCEYAVNIDEV